MTELELKFNVPAPLLASLVATLQAHGARRQRLHAIYHDTADDLLARHGMSLRLRREGAHWVQTLKTVGDSVVRREEHDVPLPGAGTERPTLDLTRHDGSQAGAALASLLARAPQPMQLVERHATDIERLHGELDVLGAVVNAALDVGRLRAGRAVAPVCELELEHVAGDPAGFFALARCWVEHGGLSLITASKAERGMRLAHGERHGPAVKAATPRLHAGMDGGALLRAVLRAALDQVLPNAGALAAGGTDAEHLHQLRIGLRRLRTALRELAAWHGALDAGWEPVLAGTFERLGAARDDAAVAATVAPILDAAGAPLPRWPAAPPPDPGDTVRATPFQCVLIDLLACALADDAGDAAVLPPEASLGHAVERLQRLHRSVVRDGRRFERLDTPGQHRVRKRLKRLRYLAEFVQPLFDAKAVDRYLRHLRPAQEALGLHNDVAVGAERFAAAASTDPGAAYAAGYLQAHLQVTARAARRALKEVAGAERFWR